MARTRPTRSEVMVGRIIASSFKKINSFEIDDRLVKSKLTVL